MAKTPTQTQPAATTPPAATTETPAAGTGTELNADDFAAAFAEFSGEEPIAIIKKEQQAAPAAAVEGVLPDPKTLEKPLEKGAEQQTQQPQKNVEGKEGGHQDDDGTQQQQGTEQPQKEAPKTEPSVLDSLKAIIGEAAKEALQPAADEGNTQTEATPARPAFTPFTAEEDKAVKDFYKDWPEVARASELLRKQELEAFWTFVQAQLAPYMSDLYSRTGHLSETSHIDQVYALVPDFNDIRDDVIKWAVDEKQPDYIRRAHEQVIQQGTPQQVAMLFNQWRAATGKEIPAVAAPAAAAAAPATQAAPKQRTPAQEAAAKELSPVASKRTNIQTDGLDPNNFEDAFKMFADKEAAERTAQEAALAVGRGVRT